MPIFRRWVLDEASVAQLSARRDARAAYAALEATAGDWGTPDPVRLALAGWRFDDARAAIAEATDWLADRDALLAQIGAAGLVAPERLRAEYERGGGSESARRELDAEAAVVAAYVTAREHAAADRSPLQEVGLLGGREPDAMLAEAQSLFADGDLVGAADLSASSSRPTRARGDRRRGAPGGGGGSHRRAAAGWRPPGPATPGDWHGPVHCSAMTRTSPTRSRFQTAADVLSGDTADVYFERARRILAAEQLDPVVVDGAVRVARTPSCAAPRSRWPTCARSWATARRSSRRPIVESLHDGDQIIPKGGRDADHGPLLRLRPVRDRPAGDPVPEHRLGDRRPPHRGRGRADPGDRLRRAARAPVASPTRWTTPAWWAAASASRPRPARGWPGWRRPAPWRTP